MALLEFGCAFSEVLGACRGHAQFQNVADLAHNLMRHLIVAFKVVVLEVVRGPVDDAESRLPCMTQEGNSSQIGLFVGVLQPTNIYDHIRATTDL